ncbi:MAG: SDR family NAD(P)-dependent oxidoreductase, partial [Rhizobiales bacterium]|nr:SDR family NAD(P)-dependent oxidoreductase [Hyphomicrobiales bacterium]
MSPPTAKPTRAVFVTGAASGIGLATAAILVERGFQVFGGVKPGKDHHHLSATGAHPVSLDVTNQESLTFAFKTVQDNLGDNRLWGLVNCAGVVTAGPIEMHSLDEARNVFDINVIGVLATTQTFLP